MLLAQPMNGLLNELRGHCAETRQVSLRYGINTGEYLVQPPIKNPVLRLATGQTSYHEELGGHRFRVASPSFFQVNTAQAEQLAALVGDFLGAAPVGLLVDAYAGVGAFAVLLADRCRRVIAVEESGPAVRDGRANSVRTPQVEWVQGKVEEVLPGLPDPPDVVLLDPPRAGCHPDVLAALAAHRPARLAYVSCDPATLARDLRVLVDSGFRLLRVQPVDMFPNTYHVEALATLQWRDGA
jgi:23S rRNA (uracil1939-C5)-methyltransferase